MWISKKEILALSADIRRIIDGETRDLRHNREGAWGILRNDIHTLATMKHEQMANLAREHTAMGDTLANISHQLKTPLTSIAVMADLLEGMLQPEDKAAEFLANIKTGLARMEWLTSALLKMAKLDAGAVAFAQEETPADILIPLALAPLHILLELKNQQIDIEYTNDAIPLIHCDPRWSAEALTNLIKNASEHSPEDSTLRITAGKNPLCTYIRVTDAGKGITPTQRANLFKRFANTNSAGHGIGLPLSLAIMRAQGGDIDVDSGRTGAAFTLKFYHNLHML